MSPDDESWGAAKNRLEFGPPAAAQPQTCPKERVTVILSKFILETRAAVTHARHTRDVGNLDDILAKLDQCAPLCEEIINPSGHKPDRSAAGRKGGAALYARRGPEHFRALARLSHQKRKAKKAVAT